MSSRQRLVGDLVAAAWAGRMREVTNLIQRHRTIVNAVDEGGGLTALHSAAGVGHIDVVRCCKGVAGMNAQKGCCCMARRACMEGILPSRSGGVNWRSGPEAEPADRCLERILVLVLCQNRGLTQFVVLSVCGEIA